METPRRNLVACGHNLRRFILPVLLLAAGGGPLALRAQVTYTYYYWDITPSSSGQGGTGTWTTSTTRWATTAFNNASLAWTGSTVNSTSSMPVFQGTPGTVTASGTMTAGGFWTRVDGYTLNVTGINFGGPLGTSNIPVFTTDTGTTTLTGTLTTGASPYIVTKDGAGTLNLAGDLSNIQRLNVDDGTVEIASTATLGSNFIMNFYNGSTLRLLSGAVIPSTVSLGLIGGTIETQSDVTITNSALGGYTKTGAGKLTIISTGIFFGATVAEGSLRVELAQVASGALYNDIYVGGGSAFELALVYDQTYADVISGGGSVTKENNSKLILTGDNTYTGGTIIQAGTLQLGNGGTTGSLFKGDEYTAAAAITNNGQLSFKRSDTLTAAYTISGTGSVTQDGSGTVVLTGANSYSGGTTINAGAIQWSNLNNFGTGNITLNGGGLRWASGNTIDVSPRLTALGANGGTLDTNSNNVTLATGISGTGGLTKTGSGTLTLTGSSSYTGYTAISTGTLAVGTGSLATASQIRLNGGTLAATTGGATLANAVSLIADSTIGGSQALTLNGAFTLNGFKTLTVANTAQTTIGGGIGESSPSILIKQGAGELQLTGANTYTGGTFIQAGTVRINNSSGSAFGTGAVTIASGATLAGAGSFTGAVQLNGTFSPGNSPGTASTGSQTWAGGGTYLWEINNGTGMAGSDPGWDLMNITGSLNITATSGNRFNIDLTSLTLGNVAGLAANFDADQNHTYLIATASGGITGFSADKFDLDLADFFNDLEGGVWAIAQSGNSLNLVFSTAAVPEPSTYAMFLGVAVCLAVAYQRRRRPISP